ncbi:MAG: DUF5615 family PIN-like protein [Verrucomicrobia bacterium]|nr:DUF5615 family PIN-like protein [Verrucomicrobiota bacterium]
MTIRLYLDEDSSDTDLLKALRLRSVDVVSTAEVGMLKQSDEEQLGWAAENQRVVYSSNRRDFYRIHSDWMRDGRSHSGIILGHQQRYSIGEQTYRLLRLIHRFTAEEMQNRVEFLSNWGSTI